MRAWYFPTWVNSAMPVTSPIAQTFFGGPQALVDLDPALRHREPERLEALGVRLAARRDEQPVERAPSSPSSRTSAPSSTAAAWAPTRSSIAVVAQAVGDERGRLGVDARQDPVAALDERHPRADPREELRELAADRAAAEHGQRPGHLRRLGRLDVRPEVDRVEPRDRRDRRARSRSRSRAGRRPSSRPVDRRRGPARTTVASPRTSSQPLALEPLDLRGVVALRDVVAPRERRRPGRARRRDAGSAPRRGHELRAAKHRLRRHARPVGALAADEPPLDERQLHRGVEPAEGADEMLAGRPSTENDDPHS